MMEESLDSVLENDNLGSGEHAYAGFGKRYAAAMIDEVLVAFVAAGAVRTMIHENATLSGLVSGNGNRWEYYGESGMEGFLVYLLTMILVRWLYFAGMESSQFKATAGKLMVGLYVEDANGGRVNFLQATGRYFGKMVSSLILYIGYLMMLGSPTKQTLHDQMSGCVVREK